MSPLISVIVPVYNKEKYVAECLNSILNQTYSNIEVIIIDDGSTDKSLEICMRYAEEDKRVKVFPQENGGPSAARNKGLDNAKGEYVAFVDADDILERNAYTLMVNELIDTKASIVVVGMKYLYKNGTRVVQFPEMDRCELDANEFMRLFFNNNIMCFSSVNKMYLREIIG